MQVRIEQRLDPKPITGIEYPQKRGWFSKPKPGTATIYPKPNVRLYVDLTEEEKAIAKQFNLHAVVLESTTTNNKEALAEAIRKAKRFSEDHPGFTKRQDEDHLEHLKRLYAPETTTKTIGDYLANPHIHVVSDAGDAQQYIDRLKNDILPKIKAAFDARSKPHAQNETFDL